MSDVLTIIEQTKKNGWLASPVQGGSRLTHPQTGQQVFVSSTKHWIWLGSPVEPSDNRAVASDSFDQWHWLLQRNEHMFMAKYSLDNHNAPVLSVEIPSEDATTPMVNKAFGSLARYSRAQGSATINLASEDTISKVYRGEQKLLSLHSSYLEPSISRETFRQYMGALQGSGWGIVRSLQDFPWDLGYKNRLRSFHTYFTISRNWATFQIPLIDERVETVLKANSEMRTLFVRYLLRLNDLWFMAKLGINVHNQVLLLLEIPAETFNFSLLRFITRTISTYIDRYAQEIQIMAALQKDPRLSKLLS